MPLRTLTLVDASVPETADLAEAVSTLFAAQVPALAVLDAEHRVVGIFSEGDVLRAVFPRWLAEVRHTAFLPDDTRALEELASRIRHRPVTEFARRAETLHADDSQIHAAERFLHTEEQALPVVDDGRFLGMLSVAALCHARLESAESGSPPQS